MRTPGGDGGGGGGSSGGGTKHHKGSKGGGHKGHKPKHPRAKKPRTPAPGGRATVGAGHGRTSTGNAGALHARGTGLAADQLGTTTAGGHGLGGVILDLVGEGMVTLGTALAAWQREQDRLANRAWRRPGGLARMGGL